jgi:Tol biopolymer transport system component
MNWDGSGLTNLTNNPAIEISPAWSPDGTHIAFARSITETNNEIFVMDADGSNVVRLTDSPSLDEYPSWSPDGSQIAFMSHRDANWEIYVMNADSPSINVCR